MYENAAMRELHALTLVGGSLFNCINPHPKPAANAISKIALASCGILTLAIMPSPVICSIATEASVTNIDTTPQENDESRGGLI